MPVINGIFIPRSPLTPAELHVDFLGHNTHILERRATIEQQSVAATLRLVNALYILTPAQHGILTSGLVSQLERGLAATARYGFREAQREIAALRVGSTQAPPVTAAIIPNVGAYGTVAAQGIAGVLQFVKTRAQRAASNVATAAMQALGSDLANPTRGLTLARDKARRALHNNVLELVGETLNLGRTAGAMALPRPPEFALRSEQLDANTCGPCEGLHGTITQVGSAQFFATLPPIGCLGGGRCRALEVFADGPHDVRAPLREAA